MKLFSPPFILGHPGDTQGCGFHRILRPLRITSHLGYISGRAESAFLQDQILRAIDPKVVIFQRQTEDGQLTHLARYREALPNAVFVFENDDAIGAVPIASWHNPYVTPNIESKISKALGLFDIITTTTHDLADYHRSLLPPGCNTPVRVAPNMLGSDDLATAQETRKNSPLKPNPTRLRIGWGGGISHGGDLAILHPVMQEFGDKIEWVFLGMDPPVPEGIIKTHAGATSPDKFLALLAALNVDLVVAPLEDNLFNRCKSNLRLLEAGACSYPVIASPVAPYLTDDPPIFAYASTTQEWIASIASFMSELPAKRAIPGEMLNFWVKSRYLLDEPKNAETRVLNWLPEHTRIFTPHIGRKGTGKVTIVTNRKELESAFLDSSDDVLYMRPGLVAPHDLSNRISALIGDVICPLSNDGGPCGFPNASAFTPIPDNIFPQLDAIAQTIAHEPIDLAAVSGPCVFIRRRVIEVLGLPENEPISLEVALLEYSVAAKSRGFTSNLNPRIYVGITSPQATSQVEAETAALRIGGRWPAMQSDEVSLRDFKQTLELEFHKLHYTTLPPQNRTDYGLWAELYDERGTQGVAAAFQTESDLSCISHISYPCEFNKTQRLGWVLFTPSNAILAPDIVPIAMKALNDADESSCLFYYFDHDHISGGKRSAPDLKPHILDIHMLLSRDYVSQAVLIRADQLPDSFHADEASIYDLVLQIVQRHGRNSARHCPNIVAHLPPFSIEEQCKTREQKLLSARGYIDWEKWPAAIGMHSVVPNLRILNYHARQNVDGSYPSVAIIIPTRDNLEMIAPCVKSLLQFTTYPNYRVIIINHCSTKPDVLDWFALISLDPRVEIVPYTDPEFNWSKINNWAAREFASDFDYLCFLNDDTRVMAPGWLTEMVGAAQTPDAGVIGARLIFPYGLIQHIGVCASAGMAGHIHKGMPLNYSGFNGIAFISHECSSVTGACMLVARELFLSGPFDEAFEHNFGDVEFGFRLHLAGKRNIVANCAELQHFEGVTRNPNQSAGDPINHIGRIRKEGEILRDKTPSKDPYWNPNLHIAYLQGGALIAGMNMDCYTVPPDLLPWAKPSSERILLYGPEAAVIDELRDGASLYRLEVNGNFCRIAHPPMANCGPWDIRIPASAAAAFARLSLDKIVLSHLGDCSPQLLQFLRRLHVPVVYRPVTAEVACPRGDLRPTNSQDFCKRGYATGECPSCINRGSSPQGHVDPRLWKLQWLRFLSDAPLDSDLSSIEVDLSCLAEPQFLDAISTVYFSSKQETQEAAE